MPKRKNPTRGRVLVQPVRTSLENYCLFSGENKRHLWRFMRQMWRT